MQFFSWQAWKVNYQHGQSHKAPPYSPALTVMDRMCGIQGRAQCKKGCKYYCYASTYTYYYRFQARQKTLAMSCTSASRNLR